MKNKKLVVDFMELKPIESPIGIFSYSDTPWFSTRHNNPEEVIKGIIKYAKYDTDWNWLMQLVDKIESLNGGQFQVNILQEGCFIQRYCSEIISDKRIMKVSADTTKMESVYSACVEAIKYWNKIKL